MRRSSASGRGIFAFGIFPRENFPCEPEDVKMDHEGITLRKLSPEDYPAFNDGIADRDLRSL